MNELIDATTLISIFKVKKLNTWCRTQLREKFLGEISGLRDFRRDLLNL